MPLPIEHYAFIGNTRTAALVGRDGSIDWLCVPRFDGTACFAALLGEPRHGRWLLAPAGQVRAVSRRYQPDSLILETDFETSEGAVRVIAQFDWAKNHMPNRPTPVPPIFEPEVAAYAIAWAAAHGRREVYVGLPTLAAIWANKVAPGIVDRYLARTSYEAQQSKEPDSSERPDNLWQPVPGPYAAHGRFDRRATMGRWQVWATVHRRSLALLFGIGVCAAGATLLARRR